LTRPGRKAADDVIEAWTCVSLFVTSDLTQHNNNMSLLDLPDDVLVHHILRPISRGMRLRTHAGDLTFLALLFVCRRLKRLVYQCCPGHCHLRPPMEQILASCLQSQRISTLKWLYTGRMYNQKDFLRSILDDVCSFGKFKPDMTIAFLPFARQSLDTDEYSPLIHIVHTFLCHVLGDPAHWHLLDWFMDDAKLYTPMVQHRYYIEFFLRNSITRRTTSSSSSSNLKRFVSWMLRRFPYKQLHEISLVLLLEGHIPLECFQHVHELTEPLYLSDVSHKTPPRRPLVQKLSSFVGRRQSRPTTWSATQWLFENGYIPQPYSDAAWKCLMEKLITTYAMYDPQTRAQAGEWMTRFMKARLDTAELCRIVHDGITELRVNHSSQISHLDAWARQVIPEAQYSQVLTAVLRDERRAKRAREPDHQ